MKFIWDRSKNEVNIKKHELDFADAYKVFQLPMLVSLDEREEYGEDRWIGIGMMDTRCVVIVYTELEDETIRVISFRKATTQESKRYEEELKNQFGSL